MKAHLVSSPDGPLKEGQTYYAVCSARVENAIFKFFFDEDFRSLSEALSRTRVCGNCIAAQNFLGDGLVYGVISATKVPQENPEGEYVAA